MIASIPKRDRRTASFLVIAGLAGGVSIARPAAPRAVREPPAIAGGNLVELLGHPRGSKLLVVHADDFGEWHAVNTATIDAFHTASISSASMMVPCPWFPEAAAYARRNPEADLGLHLTLTSERSTYRWGPVNRRESALTLLDAEGYLHKSPSLLVPRLDLRAAEGEARAQIEHALALGVRPTHLDSHQGAFYSTRPLFTTLLKVGADYGIPVMVSTSDGHGGEWLSGDSGLPHHAVVVNRISIGPGVAPDRWPAYYEDAIRRMEPGLTQMVVHLGYATEETRAATADRDTWDAEWRQRDFDFVTSRTFKRLLDEQGIKLLTWREIGRAIGR